MFAQTSPAVNQKFYNSYHLHQNQGHADWQGKIKPISANNFTYFFHFKALTPFLKDLPKFAVLDVGCGVGTLSLFLAAQGAKSVLGLDLSQRAISQAVIARNALKLKNLTFKVQQLKTRVGQFDLILASEIIEHLPDSEDFIKTLSLNLKPGGWLVLTTPYAHNWLRRQGWLKQHDLRSGHLEIFDEASLLKLFPEKNWRLISLNTTEGPLRMLLFTTPLSFFIKFIRGPLVKIFHSLDDILAGWLGKHDLQLIMRKK